MSLLPLRVVPEPRAPFCSPESFWTPEVPGDLLLPAGRSPLSSATLQGSW